MNDADEPKTPTLYSMSAKLSGKPSTVRTLRDFIAKVPEEDLDLPVYVNTSSCCNCFKLWDGLLERDVPTSGADEGKPVIVLSS